MVNKIGISLLVMLFMAATAWARVPPQPEGFNWQMLERIEASVASSLPSPSAEIVPIERPSDALVLQQLGLVAAQTDMCFYREAHATNPWGPAIEAYVFPWQSRWQLPSVPVNSRSGGDRSLQSQALTPLLC